MRGNSMNPDETIRLDLPADHRHLNILSVVVGEMLIQFDDIEDQEQVIYNIKLAAHEACTNIVEHAYEGFSGGRIQISIDIKPYPRCIIIELLDTGMPFKPDTARLPDLDNPQVHGYGLHLMHAIMDKVEYEPQVGGNQWRLMKHF